MPKSTEPANVRCFGLAAVVAALLSTHAASQETGMAMPAVCQDDLDKCSEQIWAHNSFPHRGVTQSVTFSNGVTLTCMSLGANRPRDCRLSDAISGPPQFPSVLTARDEAERALEGIPDAPAPRQCAYLKQALHDMQSVVENAQQPVDHARAFLTRVMQMTPAMLEAELQRQRLLNEFSPDGSEIAFLRDVRTGKFLGPGLSPQKLQARADRIIADEQEASDAVRDNNNAMIKKLNDRIASLGCNDASSQ